MVATVASLVTGCCGSDEWKGATFPEAGIRLMVPTSWTVTLRRPGQSAQNLGPGGLGQLSKDGAVVTAMPVLEDAALIVIATQKTAAPDLFARRVSDFIPLNAIHFTSPMQPYSLNGLHGFAGEGYGRLPSDGTSVYFRSLVLDVEGKPIIATLYAEESQRPRYETVFDAIVAQVQPLHASAMQGGSTLDRDGPQWAFERPPARATVHEQARPPMQSSTRAPDAWFAAAIATRAGPPHSGQRPLP